MTLATGVPGAQAGERYQEKEDPRSRPVKTLDEAIKSGRIPKESVEVAKRDGMAAVLIKLKLATPFQPEGELSNARVEAQRQAIAASRAAVLQKLDGLKFADAKSYESIPWMALWADTETLTVLVASKNVYRIAVDGVEDFQLGTSVPQINGDIVRRSLGTPGAGQTIAIIDSGVNGTHPFLAGKVVSEGCFSTSQPLVSGNVCPGGSDSTAAGSGVPCNLVGCAHGTQVAGIAVANDSTLFGVAPAANIIAIQVSSDFGGTPRPRVSDQLEGLERVYALRSTFDIAAVNMSIGGGEFYTSQTRCDDDHESRKDVIDNLRAAGIATVASSGNNGDDDSPVHLGIASPACISSVISVGATMGIGASEAPANWMPGATQTAPFLDLLAPGTNINTTVPGAFITGLLTGTSAAAPHVSGAIAVLAGQDPSASVTEILNALTSTGIPITDTRPSPSITTPRIQLDLAVETLTQTPLPPTNLQVDTDLGTWLVASWTDNSSSETSFVLTATPPPNSLLPPRDETVGAGTTSASLGYETAADGTILTLRPDTDYTLTVQACGAAGLCSESQPISHHTLDILPEEPDNLYLSNHTSSGVTLNWNTGFPATFVRLVRYVCGLGYDCDPTTPAIELHGDESFDVTGLTGNWLVRWRIQACSLDGCSAWVDGPAAANPSQGLPPAAPTNLHLCGSSGSPFEVCPANSIALGWDDNAGNEDSYEFEWSIAQPGVPPWNGSWNTVTLGPNDTGHSLTSWTSGLLYYFRVRACNIYGCSLYSNMVSTTAP
jgi:subtilisin family serine protease